MQEYNLKYPRNTEIYEKEHVDAKQFKIYKLYLISNVFNLIVIPASIYDNEDWTIEDRDTLKITATHIKFVRRSKKISLYEEVIEEVVIL
jgi:hypothetical protein